MAKYSGTALLAVGLALQYQLIIKKFTLMYPQRQSKKTFLNPSFPLRWLHSLSSESQLKLKANFHIMETCYNSRFLEKWQQGYFLVMELFCFLLRLTIVPHWGEKLGEQIVDVCNPWNKSGKELCALFVYTSHGPASSLWTVLPCPHSLWCNLKWMKENWSSSACQNTSGDTGLVAEICLWNWLNRDL